MKRVLVSSLAFALLASAALAQQPAPAPAPAEDYTHAILIEPTTGTVLYEKNPDQPAPTASMTKMMTALVVLDQIRAKKAKWSDPVTTSARASLMGGSQVYLRDKEVFPLQTMFTAMFVHSANDAAMAIAEHFGGEERFVRLMNEKAQQIGLKNTKYYSPHGLPGEGKPDDVSSPRDLAITGIELMKHPDIQRLAKVQTMPFRGGVFTMYNPNNLLERYSYATGIKTGTHDRAGSCITASASKNGMDLIAVYMGAKNRRQLFQTVEEAFEEAFGDYEIAQPVKAGTATPAPLPVAGGRTPTVNAVAGGDLRVLIRSDEKAKIGTEVQPTNPPAPVKKGDRVGWLVVTRDGKATGRVPLVAATDVPTQSLGQKIWNAVWPF